MRRITLIFVALISLSCSSPVLADLNRSTDIDVTNTPIVQQYLAIAAQYWHTTPQSLAAKNHCHSYTVEIGYTGSNDLGEAAQPGCWQRLSASEWEYIQGGTLGEKELREGCLAVVHEYGHSTGHEHVANPANVMYPEELWLGAVPGCTAAFPMTEAIEPRPKIPRALRGGQASRTIMIVANQLAVFSIGDIPSKDSFESRLYVDSSPTEEIGIPPRILWGINKDVSVEMIASLRKGPLMVRAFSFHGTHHITVMLKWGGS